MTEPTAATTGPAGRLCSVQLWIGAVFGGFVTGALPFTLLTLVWPSAHAVVAVTWPLAVLAVAAVLCRESTTELADDRVVAAV